MKHRVLIVGVGNVGSNLYKELEKLEPDRYDPAKGFYEKVADPWKYDFAFICVDTPMNEDGSADMSQVQAAIAENDARIYVIKSTVPPQSTNALRFMTGKRIIFCPEYYGATQHCNNFDFDFTIIGGEAEACNSLVQLLQEVYDARHRFIVTDSVTAELAKYMENCFLATKVSFCVQFYEIAKQYNISYPELRELFLCDPRVNRSHTFVYDEHPYWESHCLDKDTRAIANCVNAPFLESVIAYNENCKEKYKKD